MLHRRSAKQGRCEADDLDDVDEQRRTALELLRRAEALTDELREVIQTVKEEYGG